MADETATEETTEAEVTTEDTTEEAKTEDLLYNDDEEKTTDDESESTEEETKEKTEETEDKESEDKTEEKLEEGDFELALAEDSLLSDEQAEKTAKLIEAQGFSKEVGQEILDLNSEAVAEYAASQDALALEKMESWAEESRNDPVIGGEKLDKHIEDANKAMNALCEPSLIEILTNPKTGLGSRSDVIKLFSGLQSQMKEGSFILPGGTSQEAIGDSELFYGKQE